MEDRKISFLNAVALGVNIVVGAGILAAPSGISAMGGPAGYLVWILSTIILAPVVYTASRLPDVLGQGGFAQYCRQGLGKFWGFVGGWIYMLSYVFAMTGVLSAFHDFFLVKFSTVTALTPVGAFFAAALFVLFLLNLLPEIMFARVAGLLTLVKLAPIFIAIGFLPFYFKAMPAFSMADMSSVVGAIPLSIFAFVGFEYLCNFSDKIEGGHPAARRAILTSFIAVAALYFAFHIAVLSIMGLDALLQFKASGYAPFVSEMFPQIGSFLCMLLPITTIVTFMNSSNGILFLNSNMINGFARSGQIKLADCLQTRIFTGRPVASIALACLGSYLIAVVVGDTAKLMLGCVFVQMLVLTLVLAILIKAETNKTNYIERFVSCAALLICLAIAAYVWITIAETNYERLVALSPFFVGLALGLLIYNGCSGLKCSMGCFGGNQCKGNCSSKLNCSK